jgi:Polyketide cyclase / dehydrase and lipid transport
VRGVGVAVDVQRPREEVFDYLDVMANHECFTDHMLKAWRYSGPDRGVGSRATVDVTTAGRTDTIEIEVIDAERPVRIVERNVGSGGRRVGTGTYTLEELPGGGTRIRFDYQWLKAPLEERLMAPFARAVLRRGNARALKRLAAELSLR